MPSSPASPRDLGLKEKRFQSIEEVEAAYNIMVHRLNEVYKYNRRDHVRLTEDVAGVDGSNILCSVDPRLDNMTSGVSTQIPFDNIHYDPGGMVDMDNDLITIPETGNYVLYAMLEFANGVGDKTYQVLIKDQGFNWLAYFNRYFHATFGNIQCSNVVYLSEGDDLKIYATQGCGINTVDCQGQFFTVAKI